MNNISLLRAAILSGSAVEVVGAAEPILSTRAATGRTVRPVWAAPLLLQLAIGGHLMGRALSLSGSTVHVVSTAEPALPKRAAASGALRPTRAAPVLLLLVHQ